MKKIYLVIMFCAASLISVAQLKVASSGKVGINVGTSTPISNLSINSVGDSNCALFVKGATVGIWAERSGTASEFMAGIYLYGLIADGNQVDMKRMVLTD